MVTAISITPQICQKNTFLKNKSLRFTIISPMKKNKTKKYNLEKSKENRRKKQKKKTIKTRGFLKPSLTPR
jgi:hypothetical protein